MATIDFSGHRVVVTGGSNGIGNAMARAFRDAGAEVLVTGTRAREDYDSDLGDDDAIQAFAAEIDRLDVLVNCASMVAYRGKEFEAETFRKVMDVNLTAILQLGGALRPKLAARPGSMINVTSLTAFFSSRGNPSYSASKAAMAQLTKTLAVARAKDGIRVNAIAPGWVKTKMTEVSGGNEEIDEAILKRTPMRRWAGPEDMAEPALFLASDLAGYVTGETILVDGGFSLVIWAHDIVKGELAILLRRRVSCPG